MARHRRPSSLALFIVLVVAMLFTSLVNWTIERLAYRPLRGSFRLAPLISAIGMSIFLIELRAGHPGPAQQVDAADRLRDVIVLIERGDYGSALLQAAHHLVVTAILLPPSGIWCTRRRSAARSAPASRTRRWRRCSASTSTGRSRSPSSSAPRSRPSPARMYLMYYGVVNFADGFVPGVKAFTAAVLGGIGSLPGAVLGGLLIGLIETMWSAYFSIDYKDVAAFSILAITLIFLPGHSRPAGSREGLMMADAGCRQRRASTSAARAARMPRSPALIAFGAVPAADRLQDRSRTCATSSMLETRWPLLLRDRRDRRRRQPAAARS